jgi:DNA-binding transcriptional ArsR family regulator
MEIKSAVQTLAALAQESRLSIFRLLVQAGPTGVAAGEIAAALSLAPATLSFHLKEMSHAGLVTARAQGRFIYYAADFARMNALLGYLTENCCARDGTSCAGGTSCSPSRPASRAPSRTKGVRS